MSKTVRFSSKGTIHRMLTKDEYDRTPCWGTPDEGTPDGGTFSSQSSSFSTTETGPSFQPQRTVSFSAGAFSNVGSGFSTTETRPSSQSQNVWTGSFSNGSYGSGAIPTAGPVTSGGSFDSYLSTTGGRKAFSA